MINPMSSNDKDAIEYLEERSKENPALNYAWNILKEYYKRCLTELDEANTLLSPFETEEEKENTYRLVKKEIQNEDFFNEASEFLEMSKEEIKYLLNKKETDLYEDWNIAKINRLYNMRLKLGHSARITYIAETNLKAMLKDKDYVNKRIIENATILSALLHDVGRFYQAVNYNTLIDNEMKEKERKINDLAVDHAIAGYYYSLATSIEFHKLVKENDKEAIENFINQTIAAVVVKFHQNSNEKLSHFDFNGDLDVLDNPNMLKELSEFINKSYEEAKIMDCKISNELNTKEKEFINEFIYKIKTMIKNSKIDYSVADGFIIDIDFITGIYSGIENGMERVLKNANNKTLKEITEEIIEVINGQINKVKDSNILEETGMDLKKDIEKALTELLKYDISESIDRRFRKEDNISDTVRFTISCALSNTMDADKIDILNQRALGIYNASYQMDVFRIFPKDKKTLIELLNEYFKFNIDENNIVIDEKIIRILNGLSKEVRSALRTYLREFDIFEYNENTRTYSIKEDTNIKVEEDNVIINGKTYQTTKFRDMFKENYLEFLCDICDKEKNDFKTIKNDNYKIFQLSIKKEDLDENIKNSNTNKIETYKKILISDSLIERFKKNSDNRILDGWINDIESTDSDHLVHSTITGLLWQINQFLFVNMRNSHSYEFIKENHILDDILERYSIKAPEMKIILEEYIEYAKKFVDYMISKNKEMLTQRDLEEARDYLYNTEEKRNEKRL